MKTKTTLKSMKCKRNINIKKLREGKEKAREIWSRLAEKINMEKDSTIFS